MCRPRQYQTFVFVQGAFAGTLSPQPMNSRTDGALSQVSLQINPRLTAEYLRYAEKDALCCPSRTTRVVFEITKDGAVQPVSASTSETDQTKQAAKNKRPLEGTYWRATELAGKPTPKQDANREAFLQFQAGRVTGSDGCNRITGNYQLNGDRIAFAQVAGTQMACTDTTATEVPFRDALKNASRLTITGDRLELFNASGTRLALFVAGSPPRHGL